MKTHLNLATTDLNRSVLFYSTLLQSTPQKQLSDYALFVTENPGLELALDLRDSVRPGADAHFGIFVESGDQVERAIERLSKAGFTTEVEREETCCYAKQTKVWTADPQGRRWEVYTVHEETEGRDDPGECACCNA